MKHDQYAEHWKIAHAAALKNGLQVVEHGWEQHVVIDEVAGLVYRYPRHAAAAAKLNDEVAVLRQLHTRVWPVELPVMRTHNTFFCSYNLIVGDVLSPELIAQLSVKQLAVIAESLGTFLAALHQFDPEVVQLKKTKKDTTLLEYYTERIQGATDTPYATKAQQALQKLTADSSHMKPVVIHGDLHGLNMVINKSQTLQGVIDMSEMELGDPHQDFRKLFMTDPRLLEPARAAYRNHGGENLNTEIIKLWAYVNEWANLCYFAHSPFNATYQRALIHMQMWQQL